jgi:hypothetical protein
MGIVPTAETLVCVVLEGNLTMKMKIENHQL